MPKPFPLTPGTQPSFANPCLNQPGVSGFIDERGGMTLIRTVADEAEILTIGVTQPRQGIGKALMHAAIALAQSLGVEKLHLEVAASNLAGRAFYKSHGFEPAGQRQKYYADGSDALILTLLLSAPHSRHR